MKVILANDVEKLGRKGDVVTVADGYARNFLVPRKLAVEATPGNVKQIEAERAALLKKEATERGAAEAQSAVMRGLRLNFERKVGEHGLLYGSVTAMHIADALREKGYEMDRRRVHLAEPIKETGEYTVTVRLHREVTVEIPVVVRDERAPQAPASTPAATAAAADSGSGEAAAEGTAEGAEA